MTRYAYESNAMTHETTTELRILARDPDNRTLLLGGHGHALGAILFNATPPLIALQAIGLICLEESLWPLAGSYPLLLSIWATLWALLVVYGGTGGLHHHLYLLSPERGWLWHLNSGQVLATDDSTAGVDKHGNTALHHAATRLKVDSQTLRDDWAAWTRRPDFQPLGLADWYRRHWADRSSLAVLVFVVEVFLFVTLVAGFGPFLFAHLVTYLILLAWDLAAFWLQHRLPGRARATLAELSIDEVMGQETRAVAGDG